MTTTEAEVQTAVRGGCAIFKRIITNLETRLRGERQRLAALAAGLKRLEAQPHPNPTEVEQLKHSISTLRGQIDEDEAGLADVRIDFEMFCRG
jgi:chromosome segregation ATPase